LLGKKGRGRRPLVLCTEILRSTREKEDPERRIELKKLLVDIRKAINIQERKELEKKRDKIIDGLFKRNVGVYGAINLRTDGKTAVIAFRYERPKGIKRWFYYELKKDVNGIFQVEDVDGH